jgi:hypothetical protein
MKSIGKLIHVIALATSIATSGQTFGDEWPERPAPVSFQRCSSYGVDLQIMSELNRENVVLGLFFHLPEDFPVSSKFLHFERVGDSFVSDASESFAVEDATVELIPVSRGYRLRIEVLTDQLAEREVLEDVLRCRRGPL